MRCLKIRCSRSRFSREVTLSGSFPSRTQHHSSHATNGTTNGLSRIATYTLTAIGYSSTASGSTRVHQLPMYLAALASARTTTTADRRLNMMRSLLPACAGLVAHQGESAANSATLWRTR